jgi:hypothetical protein
MRESTANLTLRKDSRAPLTGPAPPGAPAAPLLPIIIIDMTGNIIGNDAHHHRAGAASIVGVASQHHPVAERSR